MLALLGANRRNDFAAAVCGLTRPFVAPFSNLFPTPASDGAVFEVYTLVAMLMFFRYSRRRALRRPGRLGLLLLVSPRTTDRPGRVQLLQHLQLEDPRRGAAAPVAIGGVAQRCSDANGLAPAQRLG